MPVKYNSAFNESNKRFEVWRIDEENNTKALLLSMTTDEVNELLKEYVINTLAAIGA